MGRCSNMTTESLPTRAESAHFDERGKRNESPAPNEGANMGRCSNMTTESLPTRAESAHFDERGKRNELPAPNEQAEMGRCSNMTTESLPTRAESAHFECQMVYAKWFLFRIFIHQLTPEADAPTEHRLAFTRREKRSCGLGELSSFVVRIQKTHLV